MPFPLGNAALLSPNSLTRKGSRSFSLTDNHVVSPSGIRLNGEFLCDLGSSVKSNLGSSLRTPSGGKPSLGRSRSETLLCGVSSSAEYLNSKQDQNMLVLVYGGSRGGGKLSPTRGDNPSAPVGWRGTEIDEQDFVRSTDRLVNSISDLRSRHEAFEAMGSPMQRRRRSSVGGQNIGAQVKNLSEGATQEDQEKAERLAERLEAYKMVRKVEAEIPQLTALSSLPPIKKDPAQETIIKRNASSNAIMLSSPSKKKELIQCRSEVLGQRLTWAKQARSDLEARMEQQYSEAIQRKRLQAERVAQARTEPVAKKAPPQSNLAEQWFKFIVLAASLKHLYQEVKFGRMSPEDQMKLVSDRKGRTSSVVHLTNPVVAQAIFLSEIMVDEKKCMKLRLVAAMVRAKLRVQASREHARVVYDCLESWQVGGRCFKAFKHLADRVVMLQRWWRMTARGLHEIRDQISRRWERIERGHLVQEVSRAPTLPYRVVKGGPTPAKLTLEERIEMEKVEDSVRLRFIETELRVRRYKMLPQIHLWEQDVAKWRRLYQEWQETKDAHLALGKPAPSMRIFHWPPVRPSYVPRSHPAMELRGHPCTEDCLGRQGDEEILHMWKACRRNPCLASLTPMPRRGGRHSMLGGRSAGGTVADRRAGSRSSVMRTDSLRVRSSASMSRGARDHEHGADRAAPFGDAPDEELRNWGACADALPGLSGDGDGETAAPAKLVCAPC